MLVYSRETRRDKNEGAVMGALVPLFLRWLNVDPALASSIFVTTATDVVGFLLFLGLGALALARF